MLQKSSSKDLEILKDLVEEEKLSSVIDSVYPLDNVSEAHREYEQIALLKIRKMMGY